MNCKWSEWTSCSVSCFDEGSNDFGLKSRTANCIEGINGGESCLQILGNDDGKKSQTVNCAEDIQYCSTNHIFMSWTSWTDCPKCFEKSNKNINRKRMRFCINGKYGGTLCPKNVR